MTPAAHRHALLAKSSKTTDATGRSRALPTFLPATLHASALQYLRSASPPAADIPSCGRIEILEPATTVARRLCPRPSGAASTADRSAV
jgi:hypothetical protein